METPWFNSSEAIILIFVVYRIRKKYIGWIILGIGLMYIQYTTLPLLLMEEILHHPECKNPVTNGIFTISTGAGFLPSTVFRQICPSTRLSLRFAAVARLPSARSSARTTPTREPSSHGSPRQGGQLTFLMPKPWKLFEHTMVQWYQVVYLDIVYTQ